MSEPLPHAHAVVTAAPGQAPPLDTVVLDYEARFCRRRRLVGSGGLAFLLDLPQAQHLRDGDLLELDGGGHVAVVAAPEALLEITSPTVEAAIRVAWHLGNRHMPVHFVGHALRIRHDHVMAEMAAGLGCAVRPVDAAFEPERGAYAGAAQAGGHHHHHHG